MSDRSQTDVLPFGEEDFDTILAEISPELGKKLVYDAKECVTRIAPRLLWTSSDTRNEKISGNGRGQLRTESGNPVPKNLVEIALKFGEAMCEHVYKTYPKLRECKEMQAGWECMRKVVADGECLIERDNPYTDVMLKKYCKDTAHAMYLALKSCK